MGALTEIIEMSEAAIRVEKLIEIYDQAAQTKSRDVLAFFRLYLYPWLKQEIEWAGHLNEATKEKVSEIDLELEG
jgi:hypothetical protein